MPSNLKKTSIGLLMMMLTLIEKGARPWVFLTPQRKKVKGVQV